MSLFVKTVGARMLCEPGAVSMFGKLASPVMVPLPVPWSSAPPAEGHVTGGCAALLHRDPVYCRVCRLAGRVGVRQCVAAAVARLRRVGALWRGVWRLVVERPGVCAAVERPEGPAGEQAYQVSLSHCPLPVNLPRNVFNYISYHAQTFGCELTTCYESV